MLDELKRRLRRLVRPTPPKKKRSDVRTPEGPRPGEPERPYEPFPPPKRTTESGVVEKERHDGYSGIRPRRPGEDTNMGRDIIPDITMPGRDLKPPKDDEDDEQRRGS